MLVASKKITVEDFLQMEFEGEDAYYELINGEIVKKAAPSPRHQEASVLLTSKLVNHVLPNKLGKIFNAPIDVFLDEYNHVQPDILFISTENQGIIDYKDGILGVPDLIVEIISPGSFAIDRFEKKNAYEHAGVREYWLVDPNNLSVEIYKNIGQQFELAQVASEEGKLQSIVLAGFELDIQALFIYG
ncbi:MAG: Uma2 family endonuclease [Bacteroidetes bacterium]|nr:Uma2 family endonuclease [Bacteroidota bacterium]